MDRTRASSQSLRRRMPPSWKRAPTRWAAPSSTRASPSRCPARSGPFPLDLVPRVIPADEWAGSSGARAAGPALDLFLDDVYGEQILRRRRRPAAAGALVRALPPRGGRHLPPNGVRIHVAGIDLVRDGRATSGCSRTTCARRPGVSYVMENRRTMARAFPDLFGEHRVAAGRRLSASCSGAAAPPRATDPPASSCSRPASSTRPTSSTPAGPADGRRAGRGPRPGRPRQRASTCAPRRVSSGST